MAASCRQARYDSINEMSMENNDFIPYRCYNHNGKFITVLGVHLKPFEKSAVSFKLNGVELENVTIHSGHQVFAMNAAVNASILIRNEDQVFSYSLEGCTFTMNCPNYYDQRKDGLNLCVYTGRDFHTVKRFLTFYYNFIDRIFIYVTEKENEKSFEKLKDKEDKFVIVPWYLEDLRDLNISSKVYDHVVAHNYRNYSRDSQKVQTNDCMYKNRDTDLVLMADDDEYLNFHNREFYGQLFKELQGEYDDIILYRNFCKTKPRVEQKLSAVFKRTTANCRASKKKRLEKALVLPKNCRLYEIHRCVNTKSYSLRHLNVYLAHYPYPT